MAARSPIEAAQATPRRARASGALFWCSAWGPKTPSIWREFGACPLASAGHLLIGAAGLLFPDNPLNDEGVNRTAALADAGAGPPERPPGPEA